jgi:hypothetical protein
MCRLGETVTQDDAGASWVASFSNNEIDTVRANSTLLNAVAHSASLLDERLKESCITHNVKNDVARADIVSAKEFDALVWSDRIIGIGIKADE